MSDNTCEKCNGSGQMQVNSMCGVTFSTTCSTCNGEKIITAQLLMRQEFGKQIRKKRVSLRIIMRKISKEFECSIGEWADIEAGRAPLDVINTAHTFINQKESEK